MGKLHQLLSENTEIQEIKFEGNQLNRDMQRKLKEEMAKNQSIHSLIKSQGPTATTGYEAGSNSLGSARASLNLTSNKISRLAFLSKYLKDNEIEVLDLSENSIGNTGAIEIAGILKECTSIKEVNLSRNNIG